MVFAWRANVRITGLAESPPRAAPIISITGNVIGSQETNIELSHVNRVVISGNTLYDGKQGTIRAADQPQCCRFRQHVWLAVAGRSRMAGGIRLERCSGVNISRLCAWKTSGPATPSRAERSRWSNAATAP